MLTGLPDACHLPADFAARYGLAPLARQGGGAGQTLAIVTLAALDPGAPQYFWQNVAHIPSSLRSVTVIDVDGGPGLPSDASGSGETDLDVEQSGAVAPYANVLVYQAPNTDNGFADAFLGAASQNIAGTVSTSWGESETSLQASVAAGLETPAYAAAFDEAFLEFAAQGQSGFASAGDQGAYDAYGDLGTTNLSVDTPADSPYITAAGGTTLPWLGRHIGPHGTATVTVPAQRAWGWDYMWKAAAAVSGESLARAAKSNVAGGGRGLQHDRGDPRLPAAPAISADADPNTGYLLYEPSFAGVGQPLLQGGWGGTSFVAPQLNGSAAVINSVLGHRTGFWNPASYAAAASGRSPFTALRLSGAGNDNLCYTGNPGQPYNEGSGLGYPNLARLATVLAAAGRNDPRPPRPGPVKT